ncbi:hypothetical protein DPX16_17977 [Anabarilius grahami]|uniref:Uncharacterized protein n=1 Tax=Anabarilius grahami TaxID=495550 RepID=A0A3N0XSZ7_ANAGA|nr:hypothetical protein DPX16_17977 [Anabarilius grahami]
MLNESTLGLDTLAVKLRKYLMRLLMRRVDGGWVRGVKMQDLAAIFHLIALKEIGENSTEDSDAQFGDKDVMIQKIIFNKYRKGSENAKKLQGLEQKRFDLTDEYLSPVQMEEEDDREGEKVRESHQWLSA